MLTLFRDFIRSKFALVIIGLLILSLALFGVPDFFGSLFGGNLGNSLAKAGPNRIEVSQVDRAAQEIITNDQIEARRQAEETGTEMRQTITKQDLAENGYLAQLVGQQIDRQTRDAYLNKMGLRVGKTEVLERIRNQSAFQDSFGKFDRERYGDAIRRAGYSRESEFESVTATNINLANARVGLQVAVEPTDGMSDLWTIYLNESREVRYLSFGPENLPEPVSQPTDQDIADFYESRKTSLLPPERRQFSVLAVTPSDFRHKVNVTDEDVRNEYEARPQTYSYPDQRIYSALEFESPEAALAALEKLNNGDAEDNVGGELTTGLTVIDPRRVANGNPDARQLFSADIETWQLGGNGQKLLKVTEQVAGERMPFEEAKSIVRSDLIKSRSERLFEGTYDTIEDARLSGRPLEDLADIIGAPVITYPPVTIRGLTEDGMPMINLITLGNALEEGFTLFEGSVSQRLETPDAQYLIRLDRKIDPTIPPLESVRESIRATILAEREQEALANYSAGIEARLSAGDTDLAQEAEALGVELMSSPDEGISRIAYTQDRFDPRFLNALFDAKPNERFVADLEDRRMIGVVTEISLPDQDALEAARQQSTARLASEIRQDLDISFTLMARKNIKVQENAQMIDAYLNEYLGQE